MSNSTISGNSAGSGGGIVNTAIVNLANSIIANSLNGGDIADFGTINPSGINIVKDGSFTGTNILPLDPLLAPLGDYGGDTQTHLLLPGSPAINPSGGDVSSSLTEDQRGGTRIVGDILDIGAVEFQGQTLGLLEVIINLLLSIQPLVML